MRKRIHRSNRKGGLDPLEPSHVSATGIYKCKKKKKKKSDQSLGEELTLPVYGVKLQKHPKAHDVNFTVNFPILLYPSEQVQTYHCYDHVKIPLYFQRCFVVIKKISRTTASDHRYERIF